MGRQFHLAAPSIVHLKDAAECQREDRDSASEWKPGVQHLPKILNHHQIGLRVVDLRPGDATAVASHGEGWVTAVDRPFNNTDLICPVRRKVIELDWPRYFRQQGAPFSKQVGVRTSPRVLALSSNSTK